MFSLHSFFFLFSPTSEFVPATVFLVAIFLALRLCVSMTQMTILADFFPHQCTIWQWADTTWGDLQAGLVTAPEANLPVPSGACLSFTCRWLNGTCLPLPPPSPTHTHTHTHTHCCGLQPTPYSAVLNWNSSEHLEMTEWTPGACF